jgi:hypothetical protein
VTAKTYKGKMLIDIREYYKDKDDSLKPGKKGISLNIEEFRKLCEIADEINVKIDQEIKK